MTVTRRGFLGICGAAIAGAVIPGKEAPAVKTSTGDYRLACSRYVRPHTYSNRIRVLSPQENSLAAELERTGMRHEKPEFEELGKIFAEEIKATMERPGFCDRLFRQHYAPVEKEELLYSGKVGSVGDLNLASSDGTFRFWTGTEWKEV